MAKVVDNHITFSVEKEVPPALELFFDATFRLGNYDQRLKYGTKEEASGAINLEQISANDDTLLNCDFFVSAE